MNASIGNPEADLAEFIFMVSYAIRATYLIFARSFSAKAVYLLKRVA
ncbi:hypothetical protein [Paenibacillus tyrfis]|nr:hypothetical protein [Paenibacillus tyrfis]